MKLNFRKGIVFKYSMACSVNSSVDIWHLLELCSRHSARHLDMAVNKIHMVPYLMELKSRRQVLLRNYKQNVSSGW